MTYKIDKKNDKKTKLKGKKWEKVKAMLLPFIAFFSFSQRLPLGETREAVPKEKKWEKHRSTLVYPGKVKSCAFAFGRKSPPRGSLS
jgi:hypothetical protein